MAPEQPKDNTAGPNVPLPVSSQAVRDANQVIFAWLDTIEMDQESEPTLVSAR